MFLWIIFLKVLFTGVSGLLSSPEFVLEPPSRVYISDPRGVALRCASLGSPAPTVTWINNNGRPLSAIPGVRDIFSNGTLWVGTKLPPNNMKRATYRCRAKNLAGTVISRSTTVIVVIPDELSPRVETSPVRLGGLAILKCQISAAVGPEALMTSWLIKKSSSHQPLPLPDAGRYIYGHAGTLYIRDVTEEDSISRFICRVAPKRPKRHLLPSAKNYSTYRPEIAFVSSPSANLKIINDPTGESTPRIDAGLSLAVQVADGSPFTIPCLAFAKPYPRFSWTREDHMGNMPITTLTNAIGINMPTSSELWDRGPILGSGRARPSHEGSYTCTVANAKGSDRATFKLEVLEELRVSILPKHQTVSAGGRAVIRCSVYGGPVAEIRWYKNGLPLIPHSHILVQGREVIVGGANERDIGVYQCIAANSLGEAQGASYLTIRDSLPELTHKFIAQTLQPGPSVTLTCAALGHPTPSITWIQDGQPVSSNSGQYSSSRISVGSWIDGNGQVVGQVNISSVSVLDGGLYECEASNRVGRVTHTARLNVYGPPTSRSPANLTAINKREVILPCPVAGFPLMDIQWLIDSRPLTPSLRRYPKADGTLHIREVDSSQDSKRYTCTATESRGRSASGSFFLSVLNPPVLADIKFPDNLFEGMRLSVLCTLLEGDVPISIRWTREAGARIPQDPTVSQSHAHFYSNLVFTKVQGRHAGEYTCTASNTAASTSVTAVMNVKVPPVWIVEPDDVQVVAGEDFNLECHASGTPMPTVTWRRPQGDVSLADSPEVISDGWRISLPRPGTLRIRAARSHDSGRYVCHAMNGVTPTLSKSITVEILEGASIDGRVGNETIGIGSRLALKCEVKGQLPIIFTWSQNGVPILSPTASMGISLHEEPDGRTSILVVEEAGRDHASVYTCQAANAYGADTKTFFINVVENPDPPAHVHVVRVTSRELSLAWAPPFDGNSPLTHYIVTSWIAGDKRDSTVFNTTVEAAETKAIIRGLTPGTQYHVNVLAVNGLGVSPPSPTLSITTQMEPPSDPPTDVSAKPSKRGSLTVSWQPPAGDFPSMRIIGYQIGHRLERSSDDYTWRSVRAVTTSTDIRDLKHFTTYEITVRAVNEVGSGPMASPVKATTSQTEPSSPPQNIECTPLSSQSLRVRWHSVPMNESHGTVQGYKVYFKLVSNLKGSNRAEVKRTTNLETNLQGLLQHSNYSIRALAFNAAGDGKLSSPIFCATLQDKPGPPASIKALTGGERAVLVSWLRPTRLNGDITHYTLYYRPLNANQGTSSIIVERHMSYQWEEISRMVEGLDYHSHYEFWVKASTRVGEGPPSKVVAQSPGKKVPAKIKSFGQVIEGISGHSLTIPCNVLGHPPPSVIWNPPVQTLPDFSLRFPTLHLHQAGNYTCEARNVHGRDKELWMVKVVSPPPSPTAHIQYTTETSIHLSWTLRGDGGKPVTGYVIRFKESGNDETKAEWNEEELEQNERRYALHDMKCGTTYHLQVEAVNPIGRGQPSQTVTTRTRGSVPRLPRSQDLITVNSTAITLHLYTWPSGGCPILYFLVTHRDQSTETFPSPVKLLGNTDTYTLRDLSPLTWYDVQVIAYNSAGSSPVSYQIATPSSTGATLAPELVVEVQQVGMQVPPYLDPHILAPIVSGIACTLALLLCVAIGISRGSCFGRNKGNKASVSTSESKSSLFFKKSFHGRQDSSEDLSLAARAKHDEAYGVEETTYEICPYATFCVPPMGNPFPGTPSANPDEGDVLDYSLQFQTFGHQDCLEGQHPNAVSPGGGHSSSSSSSGWLFLGGRTKGGNGNAKRAKKLPGEIRCISSDQTLPVGSALPRIAKQDRKRTEDEDNCSDSDQDDTSDNAQTYSRSSDSYRIPIKLKRGADFSFHPPDSSTESNDERSPQPPRRPPHLQHHSFVPQKQEATKQHRVNHQQPRRQASQPYAPANHTKRTNTFDSVYTVDGTLCDTAVKEHTVGTAIRPPTGFLDSREFSEAECDREQSQGRKGGNNKGRNLKIRHAFSPPGSQNAADYSIHV